MTLVMSQKSVSSSATLDNGTTNDDFDLCRSPFDFIACNDLMLGGTEEEVCSFDDVDIDEVDGVDEAVIVKGTTKNGDHPVKRSGQRSTSHRRQEEINQTRHRQLRNRCGKWLQKRVQIRTVDGEYEACVWATCCASSSSQPSSSLSSDPVLLRSPLGLSSPPSPSSYHPTVHHLQNTDNDPTLASISLPRLSSKKNTSTLPNTTLRDGKGNLQGSTQSNSIITTKRNAIFERRTIACPQQGCAKLFRETAAMRKHFATHGPRRHLCSECGRAFAERSKLKRHHFVHSGEKPFVCDFESCGKRFSLEYNLRTHHRIHLGNRPFVCPVQGCDKSFAQSTNLKTHVLGHARISTNVSTIARQERQNDEVSLNSFQLSPNAMDVAAFYETGRSSDGEGHNNKMFTC